MGEENNNNINNDLEKFDIEKLVEGVEDISDPSSIVNVLDYLEQLQEEDENFFEVLKQNVCNAVIYWEQPWYQQQENRLCRRIKCLGENETTTYRTDPICMEEHELIERNWRKFRKKYKLPDKLICLARWKNKDKSKNPKQCAEEKARRFATAYLARGLKRNTYQVFQHIRTYYGGHRRGRFSATEEKIIEICFIHKPKVIATVVASVLGREPRGVYKKLNHLSNGKPVKKRIKWTLPLASKFVQLLLKYSECGLEELKNHRIEKSIWRKIGEDLEHNDIYLQYFWYTILHVQLFVKCEVKLNKLKKKIFKKLRTYTYKVWSDIRWNNLISDFPDGFTSRFLYIICHHHVRGLKGFTRLPLENVLDYALEKVKKNKKSKKKCNKRLRTLRLNEEGQLEVVLYKKE